MLAFRPPYVLFLFLLGGGLWAGCESAPDTPAAYRAWMQDPAHGLVDRTTVGGLQLTMQYLPRGLIAHQRGTATDSLLRFRLTIRPEGTEHDVMRRGAQSLDAYRDRMQTFSFHMQDRLRLHTGDGTHRPLHVAMGHVYGLKKGREFSIVFADPSGALRASDRLDVVLTDDVLGTGITHFTFDGASLRQVPPFPSTR